ncbi:hypothetical protein M2H12_14980 [Vibrio vulnificus]|nr:hypothetical protein [Vibrio vulnificus]MCU8167004.1 hypothetical protein [Vibrio vulnificus]MCU8171443.1 hypothetical protein [Vibrio vulnificus]MCU8266215.1 hypothetical protein [Vibrio vulnificus]
MSNSNQYQDELEGVARERTLQSRVLNRKVEELKGSWMKSGLAEEVAPIVKMMEIINREEDLKTDALIYLLKRDAEVVHG